MFYGGCTSSDPPNPLALQAIKEIPVIILKMEIFIRSQDVNQPRYLRGLIVVSNTGWFIQWQTT